MRGPLKESPVRAFQAGRPAEFQRNTYFDKLEFIDYPMQQIKRQLGIWSPFGRVKFLHFIQQPKHAYGSEFLSSLPTYQWSITSVAHTDAEIIPAIRILIDDSHLSKMVQNFTQQLNGCFTPLTRTLELLKTKAASSVPQRRSQFLIYVAPWSLAYLRLTLLITSFIWGYLASQASTLIDENYALVPGYNPQGVRTSVDPPEYLYFKDADLTNYKRTSHPLVSIPSHTDNLDQPEPSWTREDMMTIILWLFKVATLAVFLPSAWHSLCWLTGVLIGDVQVVFGHFCVIYIMVSSAFWTHADVQPYLATCIVSPNQYTGSDLMKCRLENLTGAPWNWWPLRQARQRPPIGHSAVQWRCVRT